MYRGLDAKLQRDVAIKVLPDLFARDPVRLARFEREVRTLAALNHPHIAQVYGLVDLPASGGHGLVLEFVGRRGARETDHARRRHADGRVGAGGAGSGIRCNAAKSRRALWRNLGSPADDCTSASCTECVTRDRWR